MDVCMHRVPAFPNLSLIKKHDDEGLAILPGRHIHPVRILLGPDLNKKGFKECFVWTDV